MDEQIKKLIISAQGGDAGAFHELVKLHDERIMILAYQLTHNEQDAEDLYQEVFFKVYRKIGSFRFRSEFYTWLYRITVNTAYNFKRKQGKIKTVEPFEDDNSALDWIPETGSNDSDQEEIRDAISVALQDLPHRQRTVFILKHLQKLKIKDISLILNISDGTVKKYLFRAMEKLRESLKEYRYV